MLACRGIPASRSAHVAATLYRSALTLSSIWDSQCVSCRWVAARAARTRGAHSTRCVILACGHLAAICTEGWARRIALLPTVPFPVARPGVWWHVVAARAGARTTKACGVTRVRQVTYASERRIAIVVCPFGDGQQALSPPVQRTSRGDGRPPRVTPISTSRPADQYVRIGPQQWTSHGGVLHGNRPESV